MSGRTRGLVVHGVVFLVVSLVITVVVTAVVGRQKLQEETFVRGEAGTAVPADIGVDYEPITLQLPDRTLQGWWVPAQDPRGAVLVFHGQRESVADWVPAVGRLHRADLAVMVFDYSGFGASGGEPSVDALRQDAAAAFVEFEQRAGGSPTYLLGYSLGAGVLLDAYAENQMSADGVILASPFSSIRDAAVESGSIPAAMAFLLPDVYNNVAGAAEVDAPLRVVHSRTDGRFPVTMAQQVADAAPRGEIVVTDTPAHSEFLAAPQDIGAAGEEFWAAVLAAMDPAPSR